MPLSAFRPQVTQRFHEVDAYLSGIAAREGDDPTIPDSIEVRIMRGLFFVHLYGAFEFSIDQSFIRLAQYSSGHPVTCKHLEKTIFSVAMDDSFKSIQDTSDWQKRFAKRIELIDGMGGAEIVKIPDNVLSGGMQSLDTNIISLAFRVYGLKTDPFVEPSARGYIQDVVQKRHAVAHGRESPLAYGNMRAADLRKRYDALYKQSVYVLDKLDEFIVADKFVSARSRSRYGS